MVEPSLPVERGHGGGVAAGFLALILVAGMGRTCAAEAGSPPVPDSLTIMECATLAARTAPEVRIAVSELQAARFDSAGTSRNSRPRVGFFAHAMVAPEGFYDPIITNLGEYEIKAGIELPLSDGGARARARARAANQAGKAISGRDQSTREAALRAAALAAEILASRETESAEVSSYGWLNDLATLIRSGVRGGTSGPSDLLRVSLEQDAVEAALAETRADLGSKERELGQLLGGPPGSEPKVRPPGPNTDFPPTAEDSVRVVARIARLPEVLGRQFEALKAQLDLADAEHAKALTIGVSADAGLAGSNLTTLVPPEVRAGDPDADFADRLRRDKGASLTVDLDRPLIEPGAGSVTEARRADAGAAGLALTTEEDTQMRAALDLLERWRIASQRLAAAGQTAERAETNLLRVKSLYVAGELGLLDVLDARRILDDARERLAEAHEASREARIETEVQP